MNNKMKAAIYTVKFFACVLLVVAAILGLIFIGAWLDPWGPLVVMSLGVIGTIAWMVYRDRLSLYEDEDKISASEQVRVGCLDVRNSRNPNIG